MRRSNYAQTARLLRQLQDLEMLRGGEVDDGKPEDAGASPLRWVGPIKHVGAIAFSFRASSLGLLLEKPRFHPPHAPRDRRARPGAFDDRSTATTPVMPCPTDAASNWRNHQAGQPAGLFPLLLHRISGDVG